MAASAAAMHTAGIAGPSTKGTVTIVTAHAPRASFVRRPPSPGLAAPPSSPRTKNQWKSPAVSTNMPSSHSTTSCASWRAPAIQSTNGSSRPTVTP